MKARLAGYGLVAALLAGCTNLSAGTRALPETSSSVAFAAGAPVNHGHPQRLTRAAFRTIVARFGRDAKAVGLWVANYQFSYLLGIDRSRTKIVDVIDVGSKGCIGPNSIKVDASQHLWIDCANGVARGGQQDIGSGIEQEYAPNGSLRATYKWSAPCSGPSCSAYSDDGGPDGLGHVFVNFSFGRFGRYVFGSGFYWWRAGYPAEKPHFISLGAYCEPICQALFMDTDVSGNIWFTFTGGNGYFAGWGLGEVTNPTTDPQVVVVFGPGQYKLADGVFRSDGGKTLNVVDTGMQLIYQYSLPVTPASKPFNTLGPTAAGFSNGSYTLAWPMTGAFNKDGTKLAIGDADGWLDVGTVASNQWKAVLNMKLLFECFGASYTPSDR